MSESLQDGIARFLAAPELQASLAKDYIRRCVEIRDACRQEHVEGEPEPAIVASMRIARAEFEADVRAAQLGDT